MVLVTFKAKEKVEDPLVLEKKRKILQEAQQIKENWAKMNGINLEHLPGISCDKELEDEIAGQSEFAQNKVYLNYKMLEENPRLSIETALIHELEHGYIGNLQAAFKYQNPQEYEETVKQTILNLIKNSEPNPLIKREGRHFLINSESDLIDALPLSSKEREITAKFYEKLLKEYNGSVYERGAWKSIQNELIPQLNEFTSLFPANSEEKIFEYVQDYLNVQAKRYRYLLNCSTRDNNDFNINGVPDKVLSDEILLTKREKTLAKMGIKNYVATRESNIRMNDGIAGGGFFLDEEKFAYNFCWEEAKCKREATLYQLKLLREKLSLLEKEGNESLLKEAREIEEILKNDLKIYNLAQRYNKIREKIATAPKRQNILQEQIRLQLLSEEESHWSERFYLKENKRRSNFPETILTDCVENNELLKQEKQILRKIKIISQNCTIQQLPKFFLDNISNSYEYEALRKENISRIIRFFQKVKML